MIKTVINKFIFSVIFFVLVTVGVPSFILIWQFGQSFDERSSDIIDTSFDVIHGYILLAMLSSEKNIQAILNSHASYENISTIRIVDLAGTVKYSSDSTEVGKKSIDKPERAPKGFFEKTFSMEESSVYSTIRPLKIDSKCQNCHEEQNFIANLEIDTQMTQAENRYYAGVRYSLVLALSVIIILISGLYLFFNKLINNPLKSMIISLKEVGKGNLAIRRPEEKKDEFGELNRHFNNMVKKIETSLKKINELNFEQLQSTDKLVTLGELATEMAHEINNPAGIMMARLDYLKMELNELDAFEKYSEDINVVLNQMQKVATITDNILKYSKKVPFNYQQISLVELANECIKIVGPRLELRGISIDQNFNETISNKSPYIFGDFHQLKQVITNILNNAIDALNDGGNIAIKISCLSNGTKELSIEDNGPGMSDLMIEKIFMPFYTTKTAEKGTGLGLYIVKNICKYHKAEVLCESTVGQGTIFRIVFNIEK